MPNPYVPEFNLRSIEPDITEDCLDGFLYAQEQKQGREVPLVGLGWIVVACANHFHIDPLFILSLMIHESGWGRSRLARKKNNLCGWGAVDWNPFKAAWKFHSKEACIITVCDFLDRHYLTKGGKYYHGTTIRDVNRSYASDQRWGIGICRLMNQIQGFLDG